MQHFFLSAAAVAMLATGAHAATISTLAGESSTIYSWGLPDTSAYGQTFTLVADGTVNSVTFRIDDFGTSISFLAYLFAWNGSETSGAALSSVAGATSGLEGMTSITASLGNVLVSAGQYVAFFQATSGGSAGWGSSPGTDYADGAFFFQNNGGDESQFGTVPWSTDWEGRGSDLAFEITHDAVAAVPLPAGLALLAAGLGMLGFAARRRRA